MMVDADMASIADAGVVADTGSARRPHAAAAPEPTDNATPDATSDAAKAA